jgi:hypothetical protein
MILPPNREVLEKRIFKATGYDADHWNALMNNHTAHNDIIGLVLDSSRSVPSLVCTARNRTHDELEAATTMTAVADAFDAVVDDISRFYNCGFNHVCRV